MTAPTDALDLAELRRLAEAARTHDEAWWETTALRADCGMDHCDAAYIAAASPATVLALLARLERAESEREALAKHTQTILEAFRTVSPEEVIEAREGGERTRIGDALEAADQLLFELEAGR